jgi:hypothetical protein
MTKKQERVRTVDVLADEAFVDHVVREEGEGRWFCGRPGTGMYHFRVITAPRCVMLYGDIGEAIFICPESDGFEWLLTSINGGRDYILGKSKWAHKDRWGWMPQDMWHYHALKKFCELLNGG